MIGKTLARYRIVEKIGEGGMGEVYRARDEQLGRDIALKVLPASAVAHPAARQRLLHEARSASALNHPNICTIHEVDEADGHTYIAMEHVPGQPLHKLIPPGGLPAETVLRYGAQIADALAHAHARGVIHCDLKSANVVVTQEGRSKVLDFGLAMRLRPDELQDVTQSNVSLSDSRGAVAGTLPYIAPELLRADPPDARSDIWALGVMLYEMASGELPFRGRTPFELSSAILREPPPPLTAQVPAGLRAVIQHCLAKDPGQRYQGAGEVRAALETVQSDTGLIPTGPLALRAAPPRALLGAGIAAIVLLAVLVGANVGGLRDRLLGRPSLGAIRSVAVLPLDNLSRDPEQEYLADGLTEELIADLTQIRALRVTARSSVMRYKGTQKPLREIARDLKVDAVVEGTVMSSGNRVRIAAQLFDVAGDRLVWAESYERDLRDTFALQREVARAIASGIRVNLTPGERARLDAGGALDPEAYQLYLKGRYFWNKRTKPDLQKSLDLFQQAIEKDPTYARAYAGLSDTYSALGNNRFLPPDESFPKARAAAQKALEIDETLAEAHASLAFALWNYDFDWPAVEREFRRAIELNPGYATAYHWESGYLSGMGRHAEAVAAIRKAREIDPLSPRINANVGFILYFAREYDQALAELHKALEMDPASGAPYLYMGMVYLEKRDFAQAIAAFEKNSELLGGTAGSALDLAHAHAVAGHADQARKILNRVLAEQEKDYVPALWVARVYTALGEKDKAFAWLDKANEERSPQLTFLNVDPRLDRLRSDPRFQRMLRRMNFLP